MSTYKEAIRAAQRGETFLGRNLVVYPVTDTTMRTVDEDIRAGNPAGMTVIALQQTAGQGSADRKWLSPMGNLYMSRSIHVHEGECGQEMEMIAACAVTEIINELLPHAATFKYPNDILIGDAKIGGCKVPPSYDFAAADGRNVNLGVGVNLEIAPAVAGRATTCLKDHGVTLGIGAFVTSFDEKFAAIVAHYRKARDFNAVLARMGFLDGAGMITLHRNKTGERIRGTYDGFCVEMSDKGPVAKICLRNNDLTRPYAVHEHHMTGTPQRNTKILRNAMPGLDAYART